MTRASSPDLAPVGRHSPRLKPFRDLKRAAARREHDAFVLEGPHLVERFLSKAEALPSLPYALRDVLVTDAYRGRFESMDGPAACHRLHVPVGVVGERTLESVTDSVSPQGVVALVTRTGGDGALLERLLSPRRRTFRMILLTGVADPGNVGTLCRSAAAFGFDAFVTHAGADPFGPKVLRATAGSFLDLPYGSVTDATRLLKTFADMGVKTIATTPRGGRPLETLRPPPRSVLLLGSEAHGLPESWVSHADLRVSIPLAREVESLNVAVAGGILMHALARPPKKAGR